MAAHRLFHNCYDNSGRPRRIVVPVQSGHHVNRGMIATLKGDMEREQAQLGRFVTLDEPTRPMLNGAAAAGFYEPEHYPGSRYPRLQILTVGRPAGRIPAPGFACHFPARAPPSPLA